MAPAMSPTLQVDSTTVPPGKPRCLAGISEICGLAFVSVAVKAQISFSGWVTANTQGPLRYLCGVHVY